MNLDNIKKGMVIKNYPELCKILNLKKKGGEGKINQLSWVEDYVKYKKDGHKFIIEDVYTDIEVVPMQDNRGGDRSDNTHIEYIEKLILDLLAYNESKEKQKGKGKIFLSKTRLFESLAMVNTNYGYGSARTEKLSTLMDMNELNVEEWFNSTSSMLERNLNKALNSLEKQYLIYWSKKIAICKLEPVQEEPNVESTIKTDSYGETIEDFYARVHKSVTKEYREATEEEIHCIIKAERMVMEDLGCKNQQDIFIKGRWKEFQREVKKIILRDANIGFYWQSYHIIFNHENVYKEANSPDRMLLSNEDEAKYQRLLNDAINSNSYSNSEKRNKRAEIALNTYGSKNHQTNKRRSSEYYLEDSRKLGDSLIRKNALDIRDQIKKAQLSKG